MIRTIFDTRYVEYFNRATKDVPLLYALYFLCIPLAKLLRTLGLSPTWITHLSNLLALAAICALVWASNPWWFPLLWFLALCFDIADGVVARASKSASASGSFYDHISDQVKIIGLFFAVGARYDDPRIWIMAYAINSAFLLAAVVNQVVAHRRFRLSTGVVADAAPEAAANAEAASPGFGNGLRVVLNSWPRLKRFLRGTYLSVFLVYGNSMVLLLLLSFGKTAAILTMSIFSIVMARGLWQLFRAAHQVNRQLTRNAVPWKS